MKTVLDVTSALLLFEDAANKQAEATEKGDYKAANRHYASIVRAMLFLKSEKALENLSSLLTHTSVGVRLWSATYLLPVIETDARRTLQQIIDSSGIHSFTAKTTLDEWQKGSLVL